MDPSSSAAIRTPPGLRELGGGVHTHELAGELVLFVFSFWPFCIFLDFEAVCISDEQYFLFVISLRSFVI